MTLSSPGGEVVDKTLQKILQDKFMDAADQAAAEPTHWEAQASEEIFIYLFFGCATPLQGIHGKNGDIVMWGKLSLLGHLRSRPLPVMLFLWLGGSVGGQTFPIKVQCAPGKGRFQSFDLVRGTAEQISSKELNQNVWTT